jgi:hypothetical protein
MKIKEEKKKLKEETIAISRGVKQVKDKSSREIIKKEILKATQPQLTSRQQEIPIKPTSEMQEKEEAESEAEPVKVRMSKPKSVKKEPIPRRTRKVKPVETESINPIPFNSVCRRRNGEEYESEDDDPPAPKLFPPARRRPAPKYPFPFQINF